MDNEQLIPVWKSWLRKHRRSLIILGVIITLVVAVRLTLRSNWLLNKVRTKVEAAADSSVSGSVTIRKLSGDLWSHLDAIDVNVVHQDTLIHLDTLHIAYSVIENIGHPITISSVDLHGLRVLLKKQAGHPWNVQQLVPADTTTSSSSGFPFSHLAINSFTLDHSSVQIHAPGIVPDSALTIDELTLRSGLQWLSGQYHLKLPRLSFDINQPNLHKPVHLETQLSASNQRYDLGRLVITGAQTMMKASGFFAGDTSAGRVSAQFLGSPITPAEIRAFYNQYPLTEDVNLEVVADGDLQNTQVTLTASSNHLKNLTLKTQLSLHPRLAVNGLDLSVSRGNFRELTGDTTLPNVDSLNLAVNGTVPLRDWRASDIKATLSLTSLDHPDFRIEHANGTLNADSAQANFDLNVYNGGGESEIMVEASHPFDSLRADWNATLSLSDIQPNQWITSGDSVLEGTNLSGTIKAEGTGWTPSQKPWNIDLSTKPSHISGRLLTRADIHASLTDSLIESHGILKLHKSTATLTGLCRYRDSIPSYQMDIHGNRVNLADVTGFKSYPTSLNLALHIKGRQFSPKDMAIHMRVTADSSIINNERLSHLRLRASLAKQRLKVDTLSIKSTLADVNVHGHVLLNDLRSPANKFHYDISLKDIQSLTPLLGVKSLQAKGDLLGDLSMNDGTMKFVASYYLNSVSYDQMKADEISGQTEIQLTDKPQYKIYTELKSPVINGISFRDFKFTTEGQNDNKSFEGKYDISLIAHSKTGSEQTGRYYYTPDSARLKIQSFYVETPQHRLSLTRPTTIKYVHNTVSSDSITLESPDSALISLHIDRLNQDVQQGRFTAQKCNLGAIQDLFLGRHYFDGTVSGHSMVDVRADSVVTHTHIAIHSLSYEKIKLDTLRFDLDIANKRLTAKGLIRDKGITLLAGRLDCPFLLGNPAKFDTTFFTRQIKGKLNISKINLSKFSQELKYIGWKQPTGIFSFDVSLSGEAGDPVLDGSLLLHNSRFSGVPIDSLKAGFTYKHPQHKIHLFARLISKNQKAFEARGQAPLYVNLRNFHLTLPNSNDSLNANLTTSDFNLQALNGFVMPREINGLQGYVNSKIHLVGTYGQPQANGYLSVSDAGVHVRPASIKLKNIAMDLALNPDSLVVKKLHMRSGDGKLDTRGKLKLHGLQPGEFDITTTSDNFQVFNNRYYKAAISLDTKLKGTTAHPVLTGSVKIDHADVYPTQLSTNNVETVHLKSQKQDTSLALYDSLRMDMKLSAPRNVWLRSRSSPEMAIELNGNLQVQKKPNKDLQVFGNLSSRQGYITQLGKKFTLDTGELTFNGDPTNPHLNIKTTYQLRQPSDISIYYMITGTLNKPQFNYDSDPKMDLKNIISYTLFGRPFNSLLSWQQSVSGSSSGKQVAQNAAINLLMNKVEQLATDRLGIDMIEVNNSGGPGGSGTTIKMGKYINDRVFVAIQQQLGSNNPASEVILQYYLKQNLELILTQSNNAQTGVDVLWKHNY